MNGQLHTLLVDTAPLCPKFLEEKEQWDAKEWDEDGSTPDFVEAEAANKWLFNLDTVDKVLAHACAWTQVCS